MAPCSGTLVPSHPPFRSLSIASLEKAPPISLNRSVDLRFQYCTSSSTFSLSFIALVRDNFYISLCNYLIRIYIDHRILWSPGAETEHVLFSILSLECNNVFGKGQITKNISWLDDACPQLCLTLCNPLDYSPLGSSVHGIAQARILELVAISFSRGSSWPRDWNCISCLSCFGRQIL